MSHRTHIDAIDFEEIPTTLQSHLAGSFARIIGNPDFRRERFRRHREFVHTEWRDQTGHSRFPHAGHDEED